MRNYSVTLKVEMEAATPADAVVLVAEAAEGWTYFADDLESGKQFIVHMDNGEPEVEEGDE